MGKHCPKCGTEITDPNGPYCPNCLGIVNPSALVTPQPVGKKRVVREYRRTCLNCGKVWHSLASRETQLRFQTGWFLVRCVRPWVRKVGILHRLE